MLALLGLVKILATSLTVGSGGSAGDFGPSLVIGGIFRIGGSSHSLVVLSTGMGVALLLLSYRMFTATTGI